MIRERRPFSLIATNLNQRTLLSFSFYVPRFGRKVKFRAFFAPPGVVPQRDYTPFCPARGPKYSSFFFGPRPFFPSPSVFSKLAQAVFESPFPAPDSGA